MVVQVQAGARVLADREPAAAAERAGVDRGDRPRRRLIELRRLLGLLREATATGDAGAAARPRTWSTARGRCATPGRPRVELAVEGEPRALPPGVDLSAYRIVQEALTNALKHAGAARARA